MTNRAIGAPSNVDIGERDMTKLSTGKVAVVTGGATGIGLALAQAFLFKGLRVALCDINVNALEAAVSRLRNAGGTVMGIRVDVTDQKSVHSMREQVVNSFGSVDVICNNAGLYNSLESIWKMDLAKWRRLFEVNYWGVLHGIQEFVPLFLDQGSGHVLNTASISGLSIVPGTADYVSSKHAVVALSETLRVDLDMVGALNIGVTVLCPSLVKTEMGDRALGFFADAMSKSRGDRSVIGSGPNLATVLDPSVVADAALRGIEAGRLYVTPTPGSRERFVKRVQPILDTWEEI